MKIQSLFHVFLFIFHWWLHCWVYLLFFSLCLELEASSGFDLPFFLVYGSLHSVAPPFFESFRNFGLWCFLVEFFELFHCQFIFLKCIYFIIIKIQIIFSVTFVVYFNDSFYKMRTELVISLLVSYLSTGKGCTLNYLPSKKLFYLYNAGHDEILAFAIRCYQCKSTDLTNPYQCNEFMEDSDLQPRPCDSVYNAAYCIKQTGRFEGIHCY